MESETPRRPGSLGWGLGHVAEALKPGSGCRRPGRAGCVNLSSAPSAEGTGAGGELAPLEGLCEGACKLARVGETRKKKKKRVVVGRNLDKGNKSQPSLFPQLWRQLASAGAGFRSRLGAVGFCPALQVHAPGEGPLVLTAPAGAGRASLVIRAGAGGRRAGVAQPVGRVWAGEPGARASGVSVRAPGPAASRSFDPGEPQGAAAEGRGAPGPGVRGRLQKEEDEEERGRSELAGRSWAGAPG